MRQVKKVLSRGASWFVRLALLLAFMPSAVAHPAVDSQIRDLNLRIEREPDNAELYIRRGELHRVHRDWSSAEADFLAARKLDPDLASVDFHVGRMKLDAGEPVEAEKALNRFLARHPDHSLARVARARAKVRLGRPLEAVKDYDRALEGPGRPKPAYFLERARALEAAGDRHLKRALRGLDEGLARLGQPVTLELLAIELELRLGRHDAALERVERIASRSARKETWLLRRAEILEQAGRIEQARQSYAAALRAIDELPVSRRGNRAVSKLQAQAESAITRLDAKR